MRRTQQEDKLYEIRSFIADKFKDIQQQSQTLKNVEDQRKVIQTLAKITDFAEEIRKSYIILNELEYDCDEEDDEDKDSSYSFDSYFN